AELSAPFKIPQENLIFEPNGKNTAPSIGIAARMIYLRDLSARICVLPCDHLIRSQANFVGMLGKALDLCEDSLFIFGIPPYRPATGYGYIKVTGKPKGKNVFRVEKFLEKPDLKTAEKFLKDKKYFWNSGIFAGSAVCFMQEINAHLPSLYKKLFEIKKNEDISRVWGQIKPISFDYGVLEKSKKLLMFKADNLGWSDLGSWQAWDELLDKDKEANVFKGDVINIDSKNTTVLAKNHLIATIGLDSLIIVDTPDALLITKKDRSEEVKKVVDILKANKRQEHYLHRTVKRPWGSYTLLDLGVGFKIKLVEVKPKHSLSLQYHKKRSEHWVVVEGKAKIVKGKNSYCVSSNESTFIPASCVHRLTNVGESALKIVEVQTGNYLEEDDIVRLKDDFGRGKV
ncbi:mannose-1-phosphate guanylyltransferase/mannose-6-phosphate isomerase, partial [bacterium]